MPESIESEQVSPEGQRRASPVKSDIAFPYTHLEDAANIARVISENGAELSKDQIAGLFGVSAQSGTFSLRIGAARMFDLVSYVEGKYQVSDLGYRILSTDEREARVARRDAFLKVELYQKTFETFRNRTLPARPHGIESTFVSFGVAPKQKDKARLAFEKSAQYAGFFHAGKERLVEPIIPAVNGAPKPGVDVPQNPERHPEPLIPDPASQLLIKGLLERLPAPDSNWPLAERARWLRALSVNLAMIYGKNDMGEISISVPTPPPPLAAPPRPPPVASLVPPPPVSSIPTSAPKGAAGPSWEPSGDLDDEIPF